MNRGADHVALSFLFSVAGQDLGGGGHVLSGPGGLGMEAECGHEWRGENS